MIFLAMVFLILALPVLGLQALYYLKEGGLLPISIVDGLRFLHVGWGEDPAMLIWLHEKLKQIPLSLVLLSLAALCYCVARHKKKSNSSRNI